MIIFGLAFFIAAAGYGGYRYAGDRLLRVAVHKTLRHNLEHWVLGTYSLGIITTAVWLITKYAP